MRRPFSQLHYTRFQDPAPTAGTPTIITLHGYNRRGKEYGEYARAAAPNGRLLGLESYKGVFVEKEITGYTWYLGPLTAPPPVYYGDALMEIERFLWDEVERQAPNDAVLPILLGVEQGAVMAIAAALAVPDLLSGVIAIEGRYPIVPGWEPPLAPLNRLPVLLVDPPEGVAPAPNMLIGDALVQRLNAWHASASHVYAPDAGIPAEILASWVAAQEIRIKAAEPSGDR
jgi:predicted esterase